MRRHMTSVPHRFSKKKQLVLSIQFPPSGYPREALLIEMKSKTLSEGLVTKLVGLCNEEANRIAASASVQVGCAAWRVAGEEEGRYRSGMSLR